MKILLNWQSRNLFPKLKVYGTNTSPHHLWGQVMWDHVKMVLCLWVQLLFDWVGNRPLTCQQPVNSERYEVDLRWEWAEKMCGCILNNLEWCQRENRIIFNSACTDKLLLIRLAYYLICFLRGEMFVCWVGQNKTQVHDIIPLFATIYSVSQHFVMLPGLIYRLKWLLSSSVREI